MPLMCTGLADHFRVRCKGALPEAVANDRGYALAWLQVFRQKRSSEHGVRAKYLEETARDSGGVGALRKFAAGRCDRLTGVERHVIEAAALLAPVEKIQP